MMKPPWIESCLPAIVSWLEQHHPDEGCGLITKSSTSEFKFLALENLADTYHARDPETYPRTARTFYIINPLEFVKAEDRDETVRVIVHSHADVGDYFSDEDMAGAMMPQFDPDDPPEPAYPGVDYLVVSVRDKIADAASIFRFSTEQGTFVLAYRFKVTDGSFAGELDT